MQALSYVPKGEASAKDDEVTTGALCTMCRQHGISPCGVARLPAVDAAAEEGKQAEDDAAAPTQDPSTVTPEA